MNTEKDYVDIWQGELLLDDPHQNNSWSLLSNDEQKRAKTFKYPNLQKKYVYTRASLRKLLASYIEGKPQDLVIKTGPYGKPFLDHGSVHFNLSHTGNKLVIAISNINNIGVDLEQYKSRKNLSGLANKCFSEEELAFWHNLPEKQQIRMFYQFWVKKEAFVKAVGKGITVGLNRCVINPEKQTQFLSIPKEYGSVSNWKIINITHEENYACALVIKANTFTLRQRAIR